MRFQRVDIGNSVHGEYRFSSLAPVNAEKTGGRLGGEDMCRYMTKFASRSLEGNIQYETEVLHIRRVDSESRWRVTVRKQDGLESTLSFDKLVLCSGVSLQFSFQEALLGNIITGLHCTEDSLVSLSRCCS